MKGREQPSQTEQWIDWRCDCLCYWKSCVASCNWIISDPMNRESYGTFQARILGGVALPSPGISPTYRVDQAPHCRRLFTIKLSLLTQGCPLTTETDEILFIQNIPVLCCTMPTCSCDNQNPTRSPAASTHFQGIYLSILHGVILLNINPSRLFFWFWKQSFHDCLASRAPCWKTLMWSAELVIWHHLLHLDSKEGWFDLRPVPFCFHSGGTGLCRVGLWVCTAEELIPGWHSSPESGCGKEEKKAPALHCPHCPWSWVTYSLTPVAWYGHFSWFHFTPSLLDLAPPQISLVFTSWPHTYPSGLLFSDVLQSSS